MNLYTLRYRAGMAGVQDGMIMATDLEKAIKVGQVWCNSRFNHRFIRVQPTIIADESILGEATADMALPASEKAASSARDLGRGANTPLTEDLPGIPKRKSA